MPCGSNPAWMPAPRRSVRVVAVPSRYCDVALPPTWRIAPPNGFTPDLCRDTAFIVLMSMTVTPRAASSWTSGGVPAYVLDVITYSFVPSGEKSGKPSPPTLT